MKQKIRRGVIIVLGSCLGVCIGHALDLWWDVKKYPELYAMNSAPWYTSLLVWGGFSAGRACLVPFRQDRERQNREKVMELRYSAE